MKRDWDTIRELLTKLEECTLPGDMLHLSNFLPERAAEVSYHMQLLFEAGLVDGQMYMEQSTRPRDFTASRLTWNGHEFLDVIRSETIWEKTKMAFLSHGLSMTLDLVKSVASNAAAAALKSVVGG